MDIRYARTAMALTAMGLALAVACVGVQEDPLAQRLVGGWRFAKVCQYDVPPEVTPCSPIATPVEWLRFEADGTARESGPPNGAAGHYVIERRELPSGGTETLLSVGGVNMGQLSFVGDTLVLGMAYVDGPDRYFVRMPEMPTM
jgi:hypothetical protein